MTHDLFTVLTHALLAVLGAAARQLQANESRPLELLRFISGCFISAFTGVMIYFLSKAFHFDDNLAFAAAGISGWIGPQILDLTADIIRKAMGVGGNDQE
jgi:hypothetical protein